MGMLGGARGFALGFAVGLGTGMLTRDFIRNPRGKLEPALRVVLRAGIEITERSRELSQQLGEILQDTWAEVRINLKKSRERPVQRRGTAKKTRQRKPRRARASPAEAMENVVPLNPRRSS